MTPYVTAMAIFTLIGFSIFALAAGMAWLVLQGCFMVIGFLQWLTSKKER